MPIMLIILFVLLCIWILINCKTSRPDSTFVSKLHPYRRMLNYLMPTRNESVVYFDSDVRAEALLDYVKKINTHFEVDVIHCLVGAAARALADNPKVNQFAVGRRLYQRKGRFVTFSMKRKQLDRKAKLSAVKMEMRTQETFKQLSARINAEINRERSGQKTYSDKELSLFGFVPRMLMIRAFRLAQWLNYHNLLPASFIKNDPMFTSVFIANLGSLSMSAGYHHLYEWGTSPLFMMVGKIEDKPVVENNKIVIRKILPIRWSFDERIDDGLTARHGIDSYCQVLENPARYLGCLASNDQDEICLDVTLEQINE